MTDIPESQNKMTGRGFWGTWSISANDPDIAIPTSDAWAAMFEEKPEYDAAALRNYLDSRAGRHLADDLICEVAGGKDLRVAIQDTNLQDDPDLYDALRR